MPLPIMLVVVVMHLAPPLRRRREQRGGGGAPAAVRAPARPLAGLEAHQEGDAEPQEGRHRGVRLYGLLLSVMLSVLV